MKFDDLLGPEIIDKPVDVMIAEPVMDGKKVIQEGVYLQVLCYDSDEVRIRQKQVNKKYFRPIAAAGDDEMKVEKIKLDFEADYIACAVVGWKGIEDEFDREKVAKLVRNRRALKDQIESQAINTENFIDKVKKKSKASTKKRSGSKKSQKDQK